MRDRISFPGSSLQGRFEIWKQAFTVSSTSSEEMASSSEDSASEDPINIAKGRGADLKEPEKAEIARTRKVQRNQAGGKKTVRGQKDPKVETLRYPDIGVRVRVVYPYT